MLELPSEWAIKGPPAEDDRLALVERILSSTQFHRAPQLRDILRYVAARSLSEPAGMITEQQIGSKVLGRGPDFDPGHDNIVRAQMRHLRQKLDEYYRHDGREERLLLTIPKGHYVARFDPRPADAIPRTANAAEGIQDRAAGVQRPAGRRAAVALIILTAAGGLILAGRFLAPSTPGMPAAYSFYDDIFGPLGDEPHRVTSLVLGNPVVMLYAGAPSKDGKEIGAGDAVPLPPEWREKLAAAANRADRVMPYHLLQIKKRDYTGLGDATACFLLGQHMQILGRPTEVTQARFLSWDAAMRRDLIILGSPHTNDWAHGNVPNHDFRIVKMGIRNRHPRPGEADLYPCTWDESGTPVEDYGLIWAWRTPSNSRVLVLAGPSSAATGAMAMLFTDPGEFRPVYDKLKGEGREFPANWQVLMKVDIRDNLPVRTTYVTHRVYPSGS